MLHVREMTTQESKAITRLAHSRTEPARLVERAHMVWLAHQGQHAPAIARELGRSEETVRLWLKRFNHKGVAGLADDPRAGRPTTYTPEEVSEVIAAAVTAPQTLDLPFWSWRYTSRTRRASASSGVGSASSCWPRGYAGGSRSPGLASGSIPGSRKKGGHRHPLHHSARRECRRESGPDGTRSSQELCRPVPGAE